METPTDEALLREWQAARGSMARPLAIAEWAQITRALRSRQNELENPKPLEPCPICQCKARGPHVKR
jgi:hypothetical protein